MERTLRRIALAGALLVPLAAVPGHAQAPTPEGTVITNTATASWTDANGNSYTPATASVNVTVGFLAAPDISGPATGTPASPSTGNTVSYTITNQGNGTDQFSVNFVPETGLTITGWAIGATTYASQAALNAALAGTNLGHGGTVTVTLTYSVADGQGGQDLSITATATSVRDNTKDDEVETVLTPPVGRGSTTGPSGGSSSGAVNRLPSNGTTYSETFTLKNTGNATETWSLSAGSSNTTVVTIGSVTGTGVSGGQVELASGEEVTITVTYTVLDVAAGSTSNVTLTATAAGDATVTSTGTVAVTVIRAAISMTKVAYKANQSTVIEAAAAAVADRTVIPGETYYYLITVTNTGQAAAQSVSVADVIPAELRSTFAGVSAGSGNVGTWNFAYNAATFTLTATLTGNLAASGASGDSASFWIEVTVP